MADDSDSVLPDNSGAAYAKQAQGVNRVIAATRADQGARAAAAAAKPVPPSEVQRLKDNYYAFGQPLTE